MALGVVYILRNKYLLGESGTPLLKIGGTARSAYERAMELSAATGVPGSFEILFEFPTSDWKRLEKTTHRKLGPYLRAGEFFEIDTDQAIACISECEKHLALRSERSKVLRDFQVPFDDAATASEADAGVCFVKSAGGYQIFADTVPLGDLYLDQTRATYSLCSELSGNDILMAEIFSLPRLGNEWSRRAVVRRAKPRAAWIAHILKHFYIPEISRNHTSGRFVVSTNGLPVAHLVESHKTRGFIRKQQYTHYDLTELPYDVDARMLETFGARALVEENRFHVEPPIFCIGPSGIEDAIQRHLTATMKANTRMTDSQWKLNIDVAHYSAQFIYEPQISL